MPRKRPGIRYGTRVHDQVTEHTPEGTAIVLTDDSGKKHATRTVSHAWHLGSQDGPLVVMTRYRRGPWLASRCRVRKDHAPNQNEDEEEL